MLLRAYSPACTLTGMTKPVPFQNPENTGPQMEQVWVFITRDKEGHENVIGIERIGPFITGNPRTFELMKEAVRQHILPHVAETGKTVHLLTFGGRSEILGW